ncbi:MAG: FUSC family protein [Porcipelethomonas sp.]
MKFYQELQLNQAGSKSYIASFDSKKDKLKHIVIYLFKIALVVSFCLAFVTLFSAVFGQENSIAGVVVLLCILTFRFSDLGFKNSQSVFGIYLIYGILAVGPKLANLAPTGWSFCINLLCIVFLALLGCHNIILFNHSTFILSYLLLSGYDVSGKAYQMRLIGLLAGAVLTSSVLYFKHRNVQYKRGFKDLFKEFRLSSSRTRWQICLAAGISSAMLIASLLGVRRVYWTGIAAMSVLIPFRRDITYRTGYRCIGNLLGGGLFVIACLVLPESAHSILGIIGGIGTGFSASYVWQTAFNAFSAITVAVPLFGLADAVILRIISNISGAVYMWLFSKVFDPLLVFFNNQFEKVCAVCRNYTSEKKSYSSM